MRQVITIFLMLIAFSVKAQYPNTSTIGAPNTLVKARGGLTADSGIIIQYRDTLNHPSSAYKGALTVWNDTVWYRIPPRWLPLIGTSGSGGTVGGRINSIRAAEPLYIDSTDPANPIIKTDSTYLPVISDTVIIKPIIDSTENENAFVLFPWNKKITGSNYFVVDPAAGSLKIGWSGVPPSSAYRLAINGSANFLSTTLDQLRLSYDSATDMSINVGSTGTTIFTARGSSPFIQFNSPIRSNVSSNSISFTSNTVPSNSNFVAYSTGGSQQTSSSLQLNGSNTFARVLNRGSAGSTPSSNNNYSSVLVGQMIVNTPSAGTSYIFANYSVKDLVINSGTGTLQNAASFYIEKAPTGTGIPANNYAFFIGSGNSRFNGSVGFYGSPHASTILDMGAVNNMAMRITMGTTSQMYSIVDPPAGSLYFNTDSATTENSGLCNYVNGAWRLIGKPQLNISAGNLNVLWFDSTTKKITGDGNFTIYNNVLRWKTTATVGLVANGIVSGGGFGTGVITISGSTIQINGQLATISTGGGSIASASQDSATNRFLFVKPLLHNGQSRFVVTDLNGTVPQNNTAVLEIFSTERGVTFPELTTSQRDVLTAKSPTKNVTIFCTDCTATDGSTGVLQTYSSGAWRNHY